MKTLKPFILLLMISFITISASAQLNNTKWKGMFNVPQPTECVFEFRNDTLYLKVNDKDNPTVIETSSYKVDKDTVTMQKIEGGSPCGNDVIAKFKFVIKDNKMSITLLEDGCEARAMAVPTEPLEKMD